MTIEMEKGSERAIYEGQIIEQAKIEMRAHFHCALDRAHEYFKIEKKPSASMEELYNAFYECMGVFRFCCALGINTVQSGIAEYFIRVKDKLFRRAAFFLIGKGVVK